MLPSDHVKRRASEPRAWVVRPCACSQDYRGVPGGTSSGWLWSCASCQSCAGQSAPCGERFLVLMGYPNSSLSPVRLGPPPHRAPDVEQLQHHQRWYDNLLFMKCGQETAPALQQNSANRVREGRTPTETTGRCTPQYTSRCTRCLCSFRKLPAMPPRNSGPHFLEHSMLWAGQLLRQHCPRHAAACQGDRQAGETPFLACLHY